MQANDVRVLKGAAVPTALVGPVLIGVAAILAGFPGALGAGIGLLVVFVFFTLGLVAVAYASRISPQVMMIAAMTTYLVKVAALIALLKIFETATVFEPRAFGWTAIIATVVWTFGEMRGFMKLKLLYVDPQGKIPGSDGA